MGDKQKRSMLADIKLGYSCNNNCIHCVVAGQKQRALRQRGSIDRYTEEYKKEILESMRKGASMVVFTGGEPTIRKDFFELLSFAREKGLKIEVQTNGRMFSYDSFTRRMDPQGTYITVALHGDTPEIHDSITRAPKSWEQTVNGIRNLKKAGFEVYGKVVISKTNQHRLEKIAALLNELGVKRISFAFPHALGNARKNFHDVVPRYSEIKTDVHNTLEYCNSEKIDAKFEAIPFCFMEGFEDHAQNNLFKREVELKQLDSCATDWNKARVRIKTKFPQCSQCIYDSVCEGPWKEYPEFYGSEEFKPVFK